MNKKQKAYYDCVQKQIKLFVKKEKSRIFKKTCTNIHIDAFQIAKKKFNYKNRKASSYFLILKKKTHLIYSLSFYS